MANSKLSSYPLTTPASGGRVAGVQAGANVQYDVMALGGGTGGSSAIDNAIYTASAPSGDKSGETDWYNITTDFYNAFNNVTGCKIFQFRPGNYYFNQPLAPFTELQTNAPSGGTARSRVPNGEISWPHGVAIRGTGRSRGSLSATVLHFPYGGSAGIDVPDNFRNSFSDFSIIGSSTSVGNWRDVTAISAAGLITVSSFYDGSGIHGLRAGTIVYFDVVASPLLPAPFSCDRPYWVSASGLTTTAFKVEDENGVVVPTGSWTGTAYLYALPEALISLRYGGLLNVGTQIERVDLVGGYVGVAIGLGSLQYGDTQQVRNCFISQNFKAGVLTTQSTTNAHDNLIEGCDMWANGHHVLCELGNFSMINACSFVAVSTLPNYNCDIYLADTTPSTGQSVISGCDTEGYRFVAARNHVTINGCGQRSSDYVGYYIDVDKSGSAVINGGSSSTGTLKSSGGNIAVSNFHIASSMGSPVDVSGCYGASSVADARVELKNFQTGVLFYNGGDTGLNPAGQFGPKNKFKDGYFDWRGDYYDTSLPQSSFLAPNQLSTVAADANNLLGWWDASDPNTITTTGGTSTSFDISTSDGTSTGAGIIGFDSTNNYIRWGNHGLSNGQIVTFDSTVAATLVGRPMMGALPGLKHGYPYYVVGASTHYFQVSETPGGSAVDILPVAKAVTLDAYYKGGTYYDSAIGTTRYPGVGYVVDASAAWTVTNLQVHFPVKFTGANLQWVREDPAGRYWRSDMANTFVQMTASDVYFMIPYPLAGWFCLTKAPDWTTDASRTARQLSFARPNITAEIDSVSVTATMQGTVTIYVAGKVTTWTNKAWGTSHPNATASGTGVVAPNYISSSISRTDRTVQRFEPYLPNRNGVLRFTSANSQFLTIGSPLSASASGYTIVVVMRAIDDMAPIGNSGDADDFPCFLDYTSSTLFATTSSYNVSSGGDSGGFPASGAVQLADSSKIHVYMASTPSGTSSTLKMFQDLRLLPNATGPSAQAAQTQFDYIGRVGTTYSYGDICEIIVVKGDIADSEKKALAGHLMHKWMTQV